MAQKNSLLECLSTCSLTCEAALGLAGCLLEGEEEAPRPGETEEVLDLQIVTRDGAALLVTPPPHPKPYLTLFNLSTFANPSLQGTTVRPCSPPVRTGHGPPRGCPGLGPAAEGGSPPTVGRPRLAPGPDRETKWAHI